MTMTTTDTTAATWQARKARAIAFLKDKPKAGKGWTSKTYVYDKEPHNGD